MADVWTKLANPTSLPSNYGTRSSFSSDGNYLAVSHATSPFLTIYKRDGDTFTKLSNPTTIPSVLALGISFSPDGNYLAVSTDGNPVLMIYKRSGDIFTLLSSPDVTGITGGNGVAFSSTGQYLAIVHYSSPNITIYKNNGDDTFTKLTVPTTTPTGSGRAVTFSYDDTYMAVAHVNSPYFSVYKRSGDTFTKLNNPTTLPTGNGQSIKFSPDGYYLAVGHMNSPFISIYSRTGDNFTKLANPTTLPTGQGNGVDFTNNNIFLAVAHPTSPYLTLYKRSDTNTFTKQPNFTTLPASNGRDATFSEDAVYLSVTHDTAPFISIYKTDTKIYQITNYFDLANGSGSTGSSSPIWFSDKASLRYTNVDIPQGAIIQSAKIIGYAQYSDADTAIIRIYGKDEDNTTRITSNPNTYGINWTSAYVEWTLGATTSGLQYESPDIKTVVQEIIDRAGWVSGNAMGIVLNTYSIPGGSMKNISGFYDGATTSQSYYAPNLVISYTMPVATPVTIDLTGQLATVTAIALLPTLTNSVGAPVLNAIQMGNVIRYTWS